MRFGVKILIVTIVASIIIIPVMVYNDMKSPKPEIIDYQQFSTYPGDGYHRMHNVNVTVKNNGPEGWVTVFVKYQVGYPDVDDYSTSDGDTLKIKTQAVYLATGETKQLQFIRPATSTEYNFPQVTDVYAEAGNKD